MGADWITLVLVYREPGCKRCINIACFRCTAGIVCYAVWEVATSSPRGDGSSYVEARGKMEVGPERVNLKAVCGRVVIDATVGVV